MSYRFSHCEMGFVVQAERRKSTLPIETFIHEDYTCSVYETDAAFFLYHPLYPFLVIVLISLNIVTASDQEWHETSVEEESHVIINCCPENGMACSGGADCHNGICRYTCSNSPFEEGCDCRVSEPPPPPDNDTSWIVIVGHHGCAWRGLVIGAKKITEERRIS